MAKSNPIQFVNEVRAEMSKVTWPSRRETLLTSAMVFVLSFLSAAFFYFVDFLVRWGLDVYLNLAS